MSFRVENTRKNNKKENTIAFSISKFWNIHFINMYIKNKYKDINYILPKIDIFISLKNIYIIKIYIENKNSVIIYIKK